MLVPNSMFSRQGPGLFLGGACLFEPFKEGFSVALFLHVKFN